MEITMLRPVVIFVLFMIGSALLAFYWRSDSSAPHGSPLPSSPCYAPLAPRDCPPTHQGRGIVSYILFGDDDRFIVGALRNAEQVPVVYPGARSLFIVHPDVSQTVLAALRSRHALIETINLHRQRQWGLEDMPTHAWRSWRYLALDLVSDWDYMLFRDADSRLSMRERAAVDEWLSGHLGFHVMRDHSHHPWPILAGTFGARREAYRQLPFNMTSLLRRYGEYESPYFFDQKLLASIVWPVIRNQTRVHDSIFCANSDLRGAITTGFPTKREYDKTIVGNQVRPNDEPTTLPGETSPLACRRFPDWTMG